MNAYPRKIALNPNLTSDCVSRHTEDHPFGATVTILTNTRAVKEFAQPN